MRGRERGGQVGRRYLAHHQCARTRGPDVMQPGHRRHRKRDRRQGSGCSGRPDGPRDRPIDPACENAQSVQGTCRLGSASAVRPRALSSPDSHASGGKRAARSLPGDGRGAPAPGRPGERRLLRRWQRVSGGASGSHGRDVPARQHKDGCDSVDRGRSRRGSSFRRACRAAAGPGARRRAIQDGNTSEG
jgi:hypothetical protein